MKVFRWAMTGGSVLCVAAAVWLITLPQDEQAMHSLSAPAALPSEGISDSLLEVTDDEITGICVLAAADGLKSVHGTVHFRPSGSDVQVTGRIEGLVPGRYRFLIAEYGDLRGPVRGSVGEPFFRLDFQMPAEGPSLSERMSFEVGESGVATLDHVTPALTMYGPESIIGRAFVLYEASTSPSGDQVATGVIGRRNQAWSVMPASPMTGHGVGGMDNC